MTGCAYNGAPNPFATLPPLDHCLKGNIFVSGNAGYSFLYVKNGTDYYISAGSYRQFGSGTFGLTCTPQAYELNDECSNATDISNATLITFSTFRSSHPEATTTTVYRDLWYRVRFRFLTF